MSDKEEEEEESLWDQTRNAKRFIDELYKKAKEADKCSGCKRLREQLDAKNLEHANELKEHDTKFRKAEQERAFADNQKIQQLEGELQEVLTQKYRLESQIANAVRILQQDATKPPPKKDISF